MTKMTKQTLRTLLEAETRDKDDGVSGYIVSMLAKIIGENPEIRTGLLYEPLEKWHEIDVSPLPHLLPNVYFEVAKNTKDTPFPSKKFDVIIVPLLGFNSDGYRLGHGGGWYDRFLATQPQALKVGVGYEDALVDFMPEQHDRGMDVIITEKNCHLF